MVNGGTVLPILGETTIFTAGLSATNRVISIRARYWKPETPDAPKNANKPKPPEIAVPKAGKAIAYDESEWTVAADLQVELTKLDGLRKGRKTDSGKVQRLGAKLLEQYFAPKDRAMIHFRIAHVHAQSGLLKPQTVIDQSLAGLKLPLEPRDRLKLYVYIGDAQRVLNRKQPFAIRRKQSAVVYLEGLKEVLKYKLPDKLPEPPVIVRFDGFGDEEDRLEREQHRELQRQLRFQRDMINLRTALMRQIVSTYSRKPFAADELERLAKKSLTDAAAVKPLMDQLPAEARQQ